MAAFLDKVQVEVAQKRTVGIGVMDIYSSAHAVISLQDISERPISRDDSFKKTVGVDAPHIERGAVIAQHFYACSPRQKGANSDSRVAARISNLVWPKHTKWV